MAAEAELKSLIKQRSNNKDKLIAINQYLKEKVDINTSPESLQARLNRVEQLMSEFTSIEARIFELKDTEQPDVEYEEEYYSAMGGLNSWIRKLSLQERQTVNQYNSTAAVGDASEVKLPKLRIPKFKGDITEWQTFYDMFMSTIHNSTRLSPVEKFQHLKLALEGEAAFLLRHVAVTENNYIGAINKLKVRYDRKRHTINAFIKTFVDQPSFSHGSVGALKRFMDTSDDVIRGLKALGEIAEARDPWLIYLLSQKMDDKSKAAWAEYSIDMEEPKINDFLAFLQRRINTLESVTTVVPRKPTNTEAKGHVAIHRTEQNLTSASLTDTRNKPSSLHCALCSSKGHWLLNCERFVSLDVAKRLEYVKENRRCYNCLSQNHAVPVCSVLARCKKCRRKHHTLLHVINESQEANKSDAVLTEGSTNTAVKTQQVNAHCYSHVTSTNAILPTAIAKVITNQGGFKKCRILLDSGSQLNFITEACANNLGLSRKTSDVRISGLGHSQGQTTKGVVSLRIASGHLKVHDVEAHILNQITSQLPNYNLQLPHLDSLKSIKLADPTFYKPSKVDILLGAGCFFSILRCDQIEINNSQLILQDTVFGYVVAGKQAPMYSDECSSLVASVDAEEDFKLTELLTRFWETESIQSNALLRSPEEEFCETHFNQHTVVNEEGRFVVSLPFKKSTDQLGDSLQMAKTRFRYLENRFARDKQFHAAYTEFISEYLALHHMFPVSEEQLTKHAYYLPHHGVFRQSESGSKIRVVFDGSAKTTSGSSLNQCLAVGPTIQSSLFTIVLRFREHRFVFCTDVEKMYRQVLVTAADTRYQQILWRANSTEPLRHYELATVTYGLASAPFLAIRTMQEIANSIQKKYPECARAISEDMYVDDIMTGANNIHDALRLKHELTEKLGSHCFHLKKWKANNRELLVDVPIENQDMQVKDLFVNNVEPMKSVKVLGLHWNPDTDHFQFTCNLPHHEHHTKRTVLSDTSRLFDPMGWLGPVVIAAKVFLQQLWLTNLKWDDHLPANLLTQWLEIRAGFQTVDEISIPRYIATTIDCETEMHGFCDASQSAYGAVVYFRVTTTEGTVIQMITAKTRVSPVKQLTLPRLELQGAVLLTKLMNMVLSYSRISITRKYAWTDSQIVLDWLRSHPKRWTTFVGNRTAEIITTMPRDCWNHVSSEENPADCASRGMSPRVLKQHSLWWHGPAWLKQTSEHWPKQCSEYHNCEEEVSSVHTCLLILHNQWFDDIIDKYSSFARLQRQLCYIRRFIENARNPKELRLQGRFLRRQELLTSLRYICQYDQSLFFQSEISCLKNQRELLKSSMLRSLTPFLDEYGLLRVGGRLQHSNLIYETKHPIIMHRNSNITKKILVDNHINYRHAGATLLAHITSQDFWIPRGKNAAKNIIRECVICVKNKAELQTPLMGNLPAPRVTASRPFLQCGVDYAGPLNIHLRRGRGQRVHKSYICIFVCLATKAVHIELVGDMTSESFMAALKRFVARRGVPRDVYSDNGTNFVGANTKLQATFTKLITDSNSLSRYTSQMYMNWHFIPPQAPHFGGIWESAVKSTKFHLRRVIGATILTMEEMITLLTEIEGILNSRPLSAIIEPDVEVLTPSHFLIGHDNLKIPEEDITGLKLSHFTRWQMVQRLSQCFWKRWQLEYLTALNQRRKWNKMSKPVAVDDVVIIKDSNAKVCQWMMGRITSVIPGNDGVIRVATIKTKQGEVKRAVHSLCILPVTKPDPKNFTTVIQMITAKTRVSPVKQLTLPRLELQGAVLLTKLMNMVLSYSRISITRKYAWTDSQIVLDWLRSHPKRWTTFVGNRTAEIITTMPRDHKQKKLTQPLSIRIANSPQCEILQ